MVGGVISGSCRADRWGAMLVIFLLLTMLGKYPTLEESEFVRLV